MIVYREQRRWGGDRSAGAVSDLERGAVLVMPHLAFEVRDEERAQFAPAIATAKNVSFDPQKGRLGGTATPSPWLAELLRRFSDAADALVHQLLPAYAGAIQRARASFRPAEIAGRQTSWRKDDSRLHIDSFPATPVHGRRILRLFSNVNPEGRPRSWRVGEPFEQLALRFVPQLRMPLPFAGHVLRAMGITRSLRSPYDALMLQLHDRMKADLAYQREAPQTSVDLPAGATWLVFTDAVSHAATAGQYQLEQTFLVPVEAMLQPQLSPLRVLERLTKRRLV